MAPADAKEGFPSSFGRYTLTERLATGGMAEVFRAKITSAHGFEKQLVIKRILPNLAADKTFVSMFIDEAKLTAQLIHPKIVQVIDFGEVKGQYFIALEFVDGFDALALLRGAAIKQVRLPMPIGMFIAMEVLDALDYAHNARDAEGRPMRLVHRDISPSNVFIARRGDVKLGDFGIAHAQERESKTQAGTLKGKYGYMSPEQVVGSALDARSDIFAVGILLAEMLMGRRLFTAPNDLDVLLMVRDGRLERLDKYARDLPPDLDALLRKALARRTTDRFQTAGEFRDALADLLFRLGLRVSPSDLGRISADFLDVSAEATARLVEQCKRWELRAQPTGPPPRLTGEMPAVPGPPPSAPEPARPPAARTERPADVAAAARTSDDALELLVDMEDESVPPASIAPSHLDAQTAAALESMMSQPLSIVDLDKYEVPVTPPRGMAPAPAAGNSGRGPDSAADLATLSPMRIISDLAVGGETGLLRFEVPGQVREIFLVRGLPEATTSSLPGERFGNYLVARGAIRAEHLGSVQAQLPRFGGKLAEAVVGLGLLKAPDVQRLRSEHVRERALGSLAFVEGRASFFRGLRSPDEGRTLGLDPFEILGTGVLTLPIDLIQLRFGMLADYRPVAFNPPRIDPETFRLGPTPHDLWIMLDGERSVRDWMLQFPGADAQLTFLRTLYLLVETGLATLQ